LLDLRRMKLGYDEGGAGTEVGSSLVLRARVLVFHRAMPDLRRMKLGYDEGGVGTEVGSSLVLRARVLV
jgi:hypothetical protein